MYLYLLTRVLHSNRKRAPRHEEVLAVEGDEERAHDGGEHARGAVREHGLQAAALREPVAEIRAAEEQRGLDQLVVVVHAAVRPRDAHQRGLAPPTQSLSGFYSE